MDSLMRHILMAVAILCNLMFIASCSGDEGNAMPNGGDSASVELEFSLVVGGLSNDTRAGTWGDNDYDQETANKWENTIEMGKLQFLMFDENDKYLGEVEDVKYNLQTSTEDNSYNVLGTLSIDGTTIKEGKLNCKLVVLANYDSKITNLKVGDALSALLETAYTYDAEAIAKKTAYIPMWGVQTYNESNSDAAYKALTIAKGTRIDVGDIYLLRAMSKVRVTLNEDTYENYRITGVSLSDYNQSGYIVPTGYDAENTKALYYESSDKPVSFHPYTSKAGTTVDFETESEGRSYVVYVPEYETGTDANDVTTPCINVEIAPVGETSGKSYTVQLRPYEGGKATSEVVSLKRNTIYEYILELSVEAIKIGYKVMPWTDGGTNSLTYSFESTLSMENVKKTSFTEGVTTTEAVAVAYSSSRPEQYSTWLKLEVTTAFAWMVQTDNPSFGFVTKEEDGSVSAAAQYLSIDGSKTIEFMLVPLQDVSLTDDNRNRKASVFVTIQSSENGVASKMPFNSGDNKLPGEEEEILYYQVSRTTYDGLE